MTSARSRGSVFIISTFAVAFLVAWATASFNQSATSLRNAERYVDSQQAFHLAEAGLDQAIRWMNDWPAPSGIAAFDPFGGPQTLPEGQYTVTIDPDDANTTSYLDHYTITVTGQTDTLQVSRQVSLILQNESFARYIYFTDSEERVTAWGVRPIWFITGDYLDGPVHSNDRFNIFGNPVFDGAVTSAASSLNYNRGGPPLDNPQFNGGLDLGVPEVTLPLTANDLRVAAAANGSWYQGNTTLVLQSDGTMRVTNPAAGLTNQLVPLPANGAVFVNGGHATVSGTLNGQLTIGSSENVIINNNLVYADDPRSNPNSDDVLGLVAEDNVVVAAAAPYNTTIQASVMGLNASFTVENWWIGPPKGTLSVYGGIIQVSRGPVGTFNSRTGARVSGYSKSYRYDTRFRQLAPPFYPTTSEYEEQLWKEEP